MRRVHSNNKQTMTASTIQVIIVGGWSPGPLLHLKSFLNRHPTYRCVVLELSIPMPPFGGWWCCDGGVLGMVLLLGGVIWFLNWILSGTFPGISALLHFVVVLLWFRAFAAVVVRRSIERGISSVMQEVRRRPAGGNSNPTVLIGFSWGGAVIAEMMAQNLIGGSDQPSALLIAPTTALVGKIAWQRDAALRVPQRRRDGGMLENVRPISDDGASDSNRVHVVHGSYDEAFCPNQERWESSVVTTSVLRDNHVFLARSSISSLVTILDRLVSQAAMED